MIHSQKTSQSPRYPLKVLGLVLLAVFVVEGLIMLVLPSIAPWQRGSIAESVADAALLATILTPALWFIIVKPLRRMHRERGELLRRLFEAREAERSSLARDLHDELGQHLTTMLVNLRSLQNESESDATRRRVEDLLHLTAESLKEVRRISGGLRISVLEDFGLKVAIERLCEDFALAHGVTPELSVELAGTRRYGPEVETALYRIVQESLTNIARHANPKMIQVSINDVGDELHLSIRDDGEGLEGTSSITAKGDTPSLGVRSMRERVELLDGFFRISSEHGKGTLVEAQIPVSQPVVQKAEE